MVDFNDDKISIDDSEMQSTEESFNEDILLGNAIALNQEITDLKLEIDRLKELTDYNNGQRVKNKNAIKKCNIM